MYDVAKNIRMLLNKHDDKGQKLRRDQKDEIRG